MKINYKNIINDFDDATFHDCVRQLYPLFRFKYISEENVRKIDLMEKCEDLSGFYVSRYDESFHIPKEFRGTKLKSFAWQISFFMSHYFAHLPENLVPYRKKAERIISDIRNGNDDIKNMEDLVKIFICLLRCSWNKWKDSEASYLPFSFEVKSDDAEMLKDFSNHKFKIAERKEGLPWNAHKEDIYIAHSLLDNVYLNAVLIYCRLMQFEGQYIKEGEKDA